MANCGCHIPVRWSMAETTRSTTLRFRQVCRLPKSLESQDLFSVVELLAAFPDAPLSDRESPRVAVLLRLDCSYSETAPRLSKTSLSGFSSIASIG